MEYILTLLGMICFLGPILLILSMYYTFIRSSYPRKSGNGFLKTACNRGLWGEYLIVKEIDGLKQTKNLFTNVYLEDENDTTEIDIVFIHPTGIYVIESKNYSGWIFGSEKKEYWTQVLGKRKIKLFNPIWQNRKHILFFKKKLQLPSSVFKSFIVFGDRGSVKKVPYDDQFPIMKTDAIKNQLEMKIHVNPVCLTESELEEVRIFLQKHTRVKRSVKKKHIDTIRRKKEAKLHKHIVTKKNDH